MGKRSNFKRVEKDFYRTIDPRAVEALLPHLNPNDTYYEPCSGDGALIEHLWEQGIICAGQSDIEIDATNHLYHTIAELFITNPPWSREPLHEIIVNLSDQKPTWLLFDSDWAHTKQSIPYLSRLSKIVSVGRLKWIPDTTMSGKDNCSWYLFDINNEAQTKFFGRRNVN